MEWPKKHLKIFSIAILGSSMHTPFPLCQSLLIRVSFIAGKVISPCYNYACDFDSYDFEEKA